jgi:DNA-binding LytR/AlgR family response regulator
VTPDNLRVLVVDDEQPALADLAFLLGRDARVSEVRTCLTATDALHLLGEEQVDVVLLDIAMPGLSGLELASVLATFSDPPPVVFVTAYAGHAVDAFDLNAVDYLLKPVREERLREALRRICEAGGTPSAPEDTLAVDLGGVTRFVSRSDVLYVEAQGDYTRLHTATDSHLVRMPLSALEERWKDSGFLRIHRSVLVSLAHIDEVHTSNGRYSVVVAGDELPVSRRLAPSLRDLLRRHRRERP